MRPTRLGVIGLGAIGGSVAWQAARAGVERIVGFTPQPAEGVKAVRAGAVTELAGSIRRVAQASDLVVVAAPPAATLSLIERLAPMARRSGCLMTDVASVKGPVVACAARAGLERTFAGSHPMAGTHRQGFDAASADRFRDAIVYVSPVGNEDGAAREVANFWADVLEAEPVIVEADFHDEVLAWTSHLPQAVASALAGALKAHGPSGVTYGDGALHTTRLAASSVEMWRDVLLMNREAVLAALDGFEASVGALRHALHNGDARSLTQWLDAAREWRGSAGP